MLSNPLFWLFVGVVVLSVATPQGRNAWKVMINAIGSFLGLSAKKLETTATDTEELEGRVDTETAEALGDAQAAYERAQMIIDDNERDQAELKKWMANRDEAVAQYNRLTSDETPDSKQKEKIGQVSSIGQAAMEKIPGLEAAIKANAENVAWARETIKEGERLMRALPERAAQMLTEGKVAAATQELAAAQGSLADSQSAFSNSEAGKVLQRMKRKANRATAAAKAAKARANAAPVSADIAAQQLAGLGDTTSFEQFASSKSVS